MSAEKQVDYIIKIVEQGKEKIDSINKAYDILNRHAEKFEKLKIDSPLFRQLTRDAKSLKTGINSTGSSLDILSQRLDRLQAGQARAFRTDHLQKYKKMIEATQAQMKKLESQQLPSGGGSGLGGAASMFGMLGGVGLAYEGFNVAKDLVKQQFESSAKYEKMFTVLRNTFQSHDMARDSMSMITEFAAKTPFQVDELTDSFIRLANRGFVPTFEEMTRLGDLASSQGKDFSQLTEALLDAGAGEFRMLKQFGITASENKKSGKLAFTFKGQTTEIEDNEKAIQKYVLSLGSLTGVTGGMAAISKTLTGQTSNLKDKWDLLMMEMGRNNSGVFNDTISLLSSGVDLIKGWVAVPMSDTLRQESGEMTTLVNVITDINTSSTTRINLLGELVSKYPELFGNIDIEKVKNEELLKKLNDINTAYEKRIRLATTKETESAAGAGKEQAQAEVQREQMQIERLRQLLVEKNKDNRYSIAKQFMSERTFGENFTMSDPLAQNVLNDADIQGTVNKYISEYQDKLAEANQKLKEKETSYQAATTSRQNAERDEISNKVAEFRKSLWIGSDSFEKIMGGNKKIYTEFFLLWDKAKKNEKDFKRLEEIITGKAVTKTGAGSTTTTNADGVKETISGINSGGSKPTNINVTIQKFQDKIEIHAATIKESAEQVNHALTGQIIMAVNSINAMQK